MHTSPPLPVFGRGDRHDASKLRQKGEASTFASAPSPPAVIPTGRGDNTFAGLDAVWQTSYCRGDKNLAGEGNPPVGSSLFHDASARAGPSNNSEQMIRN
jgi:hypothetical protein